MTWFLILMIVVTTTLNIETAVASFRGGSDLLVSRLCLTAATCNFVFVIYAVLALYNREEFGLYTHDGRENTSLITGLAFTTFCWMMLMFVWVVEYKSRVPKTKEAGRKMAGW
jgi:hypothetical protein